MQQPCCLCIPWGTWIKSGSRIGVICLKWSNKPEIDEASSLGAFPGGEVVKNPPANAGDARDAGWIPGSWRSPGGGNSNLLQYSCLENSTDREAWRATVHGSTRVGHDLATKQPPLSSEQVPHMASFSPHNWALFHRRDKLRECKSFSQDQIAIKWQSLGLNPGYILQLILFPQLLNRCCC